MNYLTQYYKNLCEQLQEKVNLLEAEIYGAEGKFMKAMEKGTERIFNPYIQGQKRKDEIQAMRAALADKSHPIHQNPEHVAAVQRVLADIEKIDEKHPGLDIAADLAKHAVGEKPYEGSFSEFGWAKDAPQYGRATAKHMRTAVDVMRGTYKSTPTPTTGSQQY
jgi:flavorubredoxin